MPGTGPSEISAPNLRPVAGPSEISMPRLQPVGAPEVSRSTMRPAPVRASGIGPPEISMPRLRPVGVRAPEMSMADFDPAEITMANFPMPSDLPMPGGPGIGPPEISMPRLRPVRPPEVRDLFR